MENKRRAEKPCQGRHRHGIARPYARVRPRLRLSPLCCPGTLLESVGHDYQIYLWDIR